MATGEVDFKAIHVFGYSQGGFMAFRYAFERSATVGSAVVVSAGNPFGDDHLVTAPNVRKVPFAFRVGTNDFLAPITRDSELLLRNNTHLTFLNEIAGAGHAPFPIAAGEELVDIVTTLMEFQVARPLP